MNPLQHLRLLLRYDRALNLRPAVGEAVSAGSRVLDAGCGVGLLSFWASQAGAAEVVGVDFSVDLAKALVVRNGFEDTVQFFEGDLWDLDLDDARPFDTILAMIYLNDPRRDEQQTHLAHSLKERYLAPGGTMVPSGVRYTVRGWESPTQDGPTRAGKLAESVADLEGRYGFDLEPLATAIAGKPWHDFFPPKGPDGRLRLDGARALSNPCGFAEVDYAQEPTRYPETIELKMNAPGILNLLVWTQELWFADKLLFSNESVSWIGEPMRVDGGSQCTIAVGDEWRELNVASIINIA